MRSLLAPVAESPARCIRQVLSWVTLLIPVLMQIVELLVTVARVLIEEPVMLALVRVVNAMPGRHRAGAAGTVLQ